MVVAVAGQIITFAINCIWLERSRSDEVAVVVVGCDGGGRRRARRRRPEEEQMQMVLEMMNAVEELVIGEDR